MMIRTAVFFISALLVLPAVAALAQQPAPDLLEMKVDAEWQAAHTAQQHLAEALSKMIDARRKDRSELAAARAQAEALKKKCGAACEDAKPAPEPGQK